MKHITEVKIESGKVKNLIVELNLDHIILANNILDQLEEIPLDELAVLFGRGSNQIFPEDVIADFKFTGLSNYDFLFSDFLIKRNFKNILKL